MGAMLVRQQTFVPPALRRAAPVVVPAASMLCAAPAFADEIGDAAAKLSKAAYPFMKEVPWNSNLYNLNPGSADAVAWAKAVGKMIDMGAAMDTKLSAAAYPFIKDVDWTSDLFLKPVPGADPQKVMKAVDKMIVMGSAMDGAALKEAAQAHVKAIDGVDAKGVLSQGDFEAINAGLGKAIASVPTSKVMDVYNSMAGLIGSSPVPNYLYSQVNPQDAQAAYNALLEFKDVVKAAR